MDLVFYIDLDFFMFIYVFSPIDRLAASIIMPVNFLTIVSISSR